MHLCENGRKIKAQWAGRRKHRQVAHVGTSDGLKIGEVSLQLPLGQKRIE